LACNGKLQCDGTEIIWCDENWRASSVDIDSGAIVLLTPERGVKALLQEQDRKFPAEVLIRHNEPAEVYPGLSASLVNEGKIGRISLGPQFGPPY
jgi:hypothetical protein